MTSATAAAATASSAIRRAVSGHPARAARSIAEIRLSRAPSDPERRPGPSSPSTYVLSFLGRRTCHLDAASVREAHVLETQKPDAKGIGFVRPASMMPDMPAQAPDQKEKSC